MYLLHTSDGRIWITVYTFKSKALNNEWKVGIKELSSLGGNGVGLSFF